MNISLERAVDYLKDKGIVIEASPNTKVSDDLASVNEDFSKKLSDKIKQIVTNNTLVTLNNSGQYLTGEEAKDFVLSARTPYQGFIVQTTDITVQDQPNRFVYVEKV